MMRKTENGVHLIMIEIFVFMACWGLAQGCAVRAPALKAELPGAVAACQRSLLEFDQVVRGAGVADTQEARIPGYPYLRVNRFLTSVKPEETRPELLAAWLERAKKLGDAARQIELANLPAAVFEKHYPETDKPTLEKRLNSCAEGMTAYLSLNTRWAKQIMAAAENPDDYSTAARILGVYPVSGCIVLSRVDGLNASSRKAFGRLPRDAREGNTYVPEVARPDLSPARRRSLLEVARLRSRLNIPEPLPETMDQLFDFFAPVWRVLPYRESDRIGRPYWQEASRIGVDTADPITYRYPGFTRFDGEILLQLNYVAWFPSRPAAGAFDIYSGHLDGIIWRVTLGPDGRVLLYDSVHCCGCFHKYFPVSEALKVRSEPETMEEPLVLADNIPDNESGRVVVHLSQRAHYVIGLTPFANQGIEAQTYRLAPYARLRRMPLDGGSRSMFGPDNIVLGSERMERWFLWPTGVLSPGAMRQRGHHAIALVGRQHFDEPRLLERVFRWETALPAE